MGDKRKLHVKRNSAVAPISNNKTDDDDSVNSAETVLMPEVQAAVTLGVLTQQFGQQDLTGLMRALGEQIKAANAGDLGRGEAMLAAQAHTLDALFHALTQRALLNMGEYIDASETYLKLALRAQAQARATWEALSTVKNPPMVGYVNQANIAHGHQQVNNVNLGKIGDVRARKNENTPNELLEQKCGSEWMDAETTGETGKVDSEMETVGASNRTDDATG